MTASTPEISVVLPCLNEALTLASCLQEIAAALTSGQIDGEIVVAVTAAGEVLVNNQVLAERNIDALAAALGKAAPSGGGEPVIVINADAKAAHQSVIDVMQAAQRAGFNHVTFATQAPAPAQ